MSVIRVNINGREVETTVGKSILDVAEENGIDIPHLCYDNRMEIYGGCGLCVVEIEGIPKLQRACATPVRDGMVVKTHTDRIVDTRKAALRLLVSDHRGDCRPPCVLACPAHTDCQGYVGLIANGQFDEALKLIKDKIPVPASIGRICPHPCEDACRRQLVEEPISIARLKAFAGDMDLAGEKYIPEIKENTGKKVAVVGAGPAGLSNAFFLRREGHDVTIYEAMPHGGGMLRYGIPEYRLPKEVLDKEISLIEKMGVKIVYNTKLGEDISLEYLKNNYDAVFIGIGAWKSSSIRCKGEDKKGVLGGIDFLREVSTNGKAEIGKRVAVVGGGNTAMDVARTAVRLGADKVSVLYRRTREEIPAEDVEIEEAEEEGVEFNYLVAPIEITGDDKVTGIRCQKMKLGEPDASGRRKPVPIEGEEIVFDVDTVIGAIGQQVTLGNIKGLNVTKKNTIQVKEGTYETNIPKVFAGGDVVSGPKIAIEAIAQGKEASIVMDSFLRGEIKPLEESYYVKQDDLTEKDFADRERIDRAISKVLSPEKRKNNFHSINETMTVEEAMKEGSRCLECGCKDYFECQLFKYINEYDIDPDKAHGEKHKRNNEDYHPFIERNPDKCILCSKCIRVCDDVVGVTALGLIDRGFNSIASPEFGLHLRDTECISCGQCVDACPVGAIIEKSAVKKQVPVDLKTTPSVCTFCGVGCNLNLESKGEYIYRTTPREDLEEGLLCMKGKFGVDHVNNKNRILEPTVYGEKVSKNLALNHIVKKLQSVRGMYGKDSIGVLVSPRFTTEELFVLKKIADKLDTHGDQRRGGEAEFLRTQHARDGHVPAGHQLAVGFNDHPAAQAVVDQRLMRLGNAQLPGKASPLNGAFGSRAGPAVMTGDKDHLRTRLGNARGNRSNACLRAKLHADAGAAVGIFQVVDQLREVFNRVDIVVRRGRNQRHAGGGVPGFGDPGIDLCAGQMPAFPGFGPLRHFNLNFLRTAKILAGDAEPGGGDLLDRGVPLRAKALRVLTALAAVGFSADVVHGDGHALVGLLRNGAVAHGPGLKALHNGFRAFHLVQRDAAVFIEPEIQQAPQRMGLVGKVHQGGVFFKHVVAFLPHGFLQQQNGAGIIHVVLLVGTGAQLVGAGGVQRGVIAKTQGVERLVVIPLHSLADLGEAHTLHAADRIGEVFVDDRAVDAHALKDLGGLVGLDGGDAHFGGDLHDAVENGAVIVVHRRAGVFVQEPHRHQLCHALLGEVGVDRLRAVAQ